MSNLCLGVGCLYATKMFIDIWNWKILLCIATLPLASRSVTLALPMWFSWQLLIIDYHWQIRNQKIAIFSSKRNINSVDGVKLLHRCTMSLHKGVVSVHAKPNIVGMVIEKVLGNSHILSDIREVIENYRKETLLKDMLETSVWSF